MADFTMFQDPQYTHCLVQFMHDDRLIRTIENLPSFCVSAYGTEEHMTELKESCEHPEQFEVVRTCVPVALTRSPKTDIYKRGQELFDAYREYMAQQKQLVDAKKNNVLPAARLANDTRFTMALQENIERLKDAYARGDVDALMKMVTFADDDDKLVTVDDELVKVAASHRAVDKLPFTHMIHGQNFQVFGMLRDMETVGRLDKLVYEHEKKVNSLLEEALQREFDALNADGKVTEAHIALAMDDWADSHPAPWTVTYEAHLQTAYNEAKEVWTRQWIESHSVSAASEVPTFPERLDLELLWSKTWLAAARAKAQKTGEAVDESLYNLEAASKQTDIELQAFYMRLEKRKLKLKVGHESYAELYEWFKQQWVKKHTGLPSGTVVPDAPPASELLDESKFAPTDPVTKLPFKFVGWLDKNERPDKLSYPPMEHAKPVRIDVANWVEAKVNAEWKLRFQKLGHDIPDKQTVLAKYFAPSELETPNLLNKHLEEYVLVFYGPHSSKVDAISWIDSQSKTHKILLERMHTFVHPMYTVIDPIDGFMGSHQVSGSEERLNPIRENIRNAKNIEKSLRTEADLLKNSIKVHTIDGSDLKTSEIYPNGMTQEEFERDVVAVRHETALVREERQKRRDERQTRNIQRLADKFGVTFETASEMLHNPPKHAAWADASSASPIKLWKTDVPDMEEDSDDEFVIDDSGSHRTLEDIFVNAWNHYPWAAKFFPTTVPSRR